MSGEPEYKYLSDTEFETIIKSTVDLILILVTANGSGLGYIVESNLAALPKTIKNRISIFKMDHTENKNSISTYSIHEVPSLLFFNQGKMIDNIVGLQTKEELISKIQLNLKLIHSR